MIFKSFHFVAILILCLNQGFSTNVLFSPHYTLQTDICIYGGTSAGIIAAVTATRLGKKVILIEPSPHLGGLTTGGLGQTDIGNKYAITGIARDFYRRIGKKYNQFEQWTFEPHIASAVFNQYLKESKIIPMMGYELVSLDKQTSRIISINIQHSRANSRPIIIQAKMFLDCTYEGDLMAKAGVKYIIGRESNATYHETYNGVQLLNKHQFPDGVDPYIIPGDSSSGLLWGVNNEPLQPNGTGDHRVQTYNFRLCLTNDPKNRLPILKPDGYRPEQFELLSRQIQKQTPDTLNWQLLHIAKMPNHKTDINNCGGFSSDMIGMNYDYPEASWAERKKIISAHEHYTRSWLYFLGHDDRVPEHLRHEMLTWGWPKDEYLFNRHFTPQLYIREARRMIGEYVMTQHNCQGKDTVDDGIGLAAYTMDSHNCQRTVVNGMVKNEGDVQIGGFGPYPIAYRSITPKLSECENLLVPVCLSATHIAYGSIRMEPVFMVIAQSAATAAVMAIDTKTSVQHINVSDLQSKLKNNPMANRRPAEILLDNDDPIHINSGTWTKDMTHHDRYGHSFSHAQEKDAEFTFRFPIHFKSGLYQIRAYCPAATSASDHLTLSIKSGQHVKLISKPIKQKNEWLDCDRIYFDSANENHVRVLKGKNQTGALIADAILLIPVLK